jgi:hypothetical protein
MNIGGRAVTVDPEQGPGRVVIAEVTASLTDADQVVREAAFRRILATGRPWDPASATDLGIDAASIRAAVDHLVEAGRARMDEQRRVTAAAGLSTDPTPHHIRVGSDPRWTNCAYDALGILGALGTDGEVESRSPATAETIRVRFERGRPVGSYAVLFLADQSCCSRPNEDWCPNVNLFEDEALALRWAEEHAVDGRVVSLEEGTEIGAVEWRPLVEGHPWTAPAPPAGAQPAREDR